MRITFRQGVVQAEQQFIQVSSAYASLVVQNVPLIATISAGTKDYLVIEKDSVQHAWGPLAPGRTTWLYIDIDVRTAARTFGKTDLAPVVSAITPVSPAVGLHWFDTTTRTMKVWAGSVWQVKNRVFLCMLNGGSIPTSMSLNSDFTGTQVGDNSTIFAGQIVFDFSNAPLKGTDGKFVTTEDTLRTQVASGVGVKMAALVSIAEAAENLSAYSVVRYVDFDRINRADPSDSTETGQFGMIESSAAKGEYVNVVTSGLVTNASWDWTSTGVNQPLYCDSTGLLVTSSVVPNQTPVATIVGKQTIQLGTPRVTINSLQTNNTFVQADTMTDVVPGIARLNIPSATPTTPVVVGANDPRLSDSRTPLAHIHSPDDVTGLRASLTNTLYVTGGTMTGTLVLHGDPVSNLDAATKQYVDARAVPGIPTTGGTMSGALILYADPSASLGAATKQYVDTRVLRSGDTMAGPLVLPANPTNNLEAAPKQYVDTRVLRSGDTMTGALTLSANPTDSLHAATKSYVDTSVATSLSRSGGTMTGPLILQANPASAFQAATKQYVDNSVASISSLGVSSVNGKQGVVVLGASDISITDANNRILATNVEDALQEVALSASNALTQANLAVTSGASLGAGTAVFSSKSGSALQFKSIVAGSNISITTDASTVTINSTASGEANTASNLGAGVGLFGTKVGTDLRFKSLIAGSNVTLTPTSTDITISVPAPGETNTGTNLGTGNGIYVSKSGTALQFKSLLAGANITITPTGTDLTISTSGAAGEINTASNLGTGVGLFSTKAGVDLEFNSLVAGTGISISTPSSGNITISSSGEANTGTNLGTGNGLYTSKSGTTLQFKSLIAGTNVTLTPSSTDITINAATPVASAIVITDTGNYYSTKNVEFALQYLGARNIQCIPIACSDETTALATGTAIVTFRMPYAFSLTAVRASLTTAQTSGTILTVNIKQNGTTILSTLLTFDNTSKTTKTATTPAVISTSALTDDAEMTIDITQIGDGTAKGLKVYLIGRDT